ncbi:MAG: metallophosphoesterase family protein [Flavobacterium sp.]|nr:metallophosphoesterase family protein [Flavobacterium sp.]
MVEINDMKLEKIFFVLFLFVSHFVIAQSQTFISFGNGTTTLGSQWKYLADGSNQGTLWRNSSFVDTLWPIGNSEFGYGETDQNTTISFGPDSNNKYITTYFRKTISIPNLSVFSSMVMNIKRDDGIVVYVNGVQVFIDNLTANPAYNLTATLASDDGNTVLNAVLPTSFFATGDNVIAVEIHQNSITSSDITFDMELIGTSETNITRGPYLQLGSTDGVTIRWRTDVATDSKVTWGTTFGIYPDSIVNSSLTTEHSVRISPLLADTKYYYTVGSSIYTLQSDISNNFITLPPENTNRKMCFIGLGDCGNNSTNQINVRNSLINYIGSNDIDAMLLFGDNAYNTGTDVEYQNNFFNIYKDNFLKKYKLYPAPGNHDYGNSSSNTGSRTMPYHLNFTVPQAGELGGVPSGVANYYSYNIGNVHFVSLDSYGRDDANTTKMYDMNGAQVAWLLADLEANTKKWTVVYFHHPPYTKTSHDSDAELDLVAIRERFIRVLEQKGVDLVLCGHSHGYERSYLLKGYYNNFNAPLFDSDFNPTLHTATGTLQNATYNGSSNSCAYTYNSGKYNHGTVYAVSGSAGALGGTSAGYPHNCMHYSNSTNGGAFYFEVEDNRLDAKFISYDTAAPTVPIVRDQFTIFKDVNKVNNITVIQNSPLTLTASWNGTYNWIANGNATTKSIAVSTANAGLFAYQVKDEYNCITDTFNVTILPQTVAVSTKFFIEGYYNVATNTMRSVKNNQDGSSPLTDVEDVIIELHHASAPYEIVATTTGTLQTDGTLEASFNNTPTGSYYIAIKSSNLVQTWSAAPQAISTTPLTYDFTTTASKAYGNNMKEVAADVWAFYSGDINQDDAIDNSDSDTLFTDIENSNYGVLATDLNGDGAVDNSDTDAFFNNVENSIYSNHP